MIETRIPGELENTGDLRAIIHVGTLGFTRSEILGADKWKPGGTIWVDPDTTLVEFEIVGKPTTRIRPKFKNLIIFREPKKPSSRLPIKPRLY